MDSSHCLNVRCYGFSGSHEDSCELNTPIFPPGYTFLGAYEVNPLAHHTPPEFKNNRMMLSLLSGNRWSSFRGLIRLSRALGGP